MKWLDQDYKAHILYTHNYDLVFFSLFSDEILRREERITRVNDEFFISLLAVPNCF